MALNGPQALKSLDDAVRDIRREEGDIAKRLARSAERVAKIRESEAELFGHLARVRLGDSERDALTGRLSRAEAAAREKLDQHAGEVAAAQKELGEMDSQVAKLAGARRRHVKFLDGAQGELKALSAKIATAIAKDPDYETRKDQAAKLRAVAEESLAKTEQAEADQEDKGAPYRQDSLFMYLWNAGYGTSSYKAGNLTRWLDGLVARMVRYRDARPNFAMLNEIPLRLREHAGRQVANAEAAQDSLDALEEKAVDAAGGRPLRENVAKAQASIGKIDAEMVALEDRRDESAEAFRHLAEGRDPAFAEAIRVLSDGLAQEDLTALLADARRTRTREDDTVVAKIEDARLRIAEEETDTAGDKARLRKLAARRRELEDIEWEFKKKRFDDPRSTFGNKDLAGDLLGEFLRGAITAASYWNQWQSSQRWRAGTTDWGGGFGLPRGGRTPKRPASASGSRSRSSWGRLPGHSGSSSGSFSRPRSSSRTRSGSRGSRKSGGFKTGGGF